MRKLVGNSIDGGLRRRVTCHCLVAVALSLFAVSTAAQNLQLDSCEGVPDTPRSLSPDQTLQRDMKANELHVYELTLSVNQYVHVVVEQKGVDVIARLVDPSGALILRDSPNGKFGPEQISAIARSAGTYRVEVCTGKNEPAGAYELRLQGPRAVVAADEKRVAAETLLREGGEEFRNPNTDGRKAALDRYSNALAIWNELGDKLEQGYTLCAIGEVNRSLGKDYLNVTISNLKQALSLLEAVQDIDGQAYVRNAMGAALRDSSETPADAVNEYKAGITLHQSLGDRWGEGHLQNNLGYLYNRLGQNLSALEHFNAALTIWQDLRVRKLELLTRNNIATANIELGNVSLAEQQFQDLLNTCKLEKSNCQEPAVRDGLGMVYDIWGRPDDAFEQYNLALDYLHQPNQADDRVEANVLDNLGMLYASLNDPQTALLKFQKALELRKRLGFSGDEAVTHSNLAYALILLDQRNEALTELQQALSLAENKNVRFKGYTLMREGILNASLNQSLKASESYNAGLTVMRNIADTRGEAMILDKIAELNVSSGAVAQAREVYQRARKLWQDISDLQGEANSLYGLARLERKQNNLLLARDNIVAAINKVESLRTSMTNDRFRRTYFEARHDYYELEIAIRMERYFWLRDRNDSAGAAKELDAALFASERARARNLIELLTESHADIRQGVDPELLDREQDQRKKLAEKLELLQNVLAQKAKNEEQEKSRQREVDAVQGEVKRLELSLDQTLAEIRRRSPRYAALTHPQPLRPNQIQLLLDDNTCLLQYALGEDRSYLWLVTRHDILPYKLPSRTKIEKAALALRDAIRLREPLTGDPERIRRLRTAEQEFRARAYELSNLILDPVAPRLGNKRLVIIADGALQYIPFSALPTPNGLVSRRAGADQQFPYLIAQHEIIYEPSASALALLGNDRTERPSRTVAVFADPVFSSKDERVKSGTETKKPDPALTEDTSLKQTLRGAGDTGSVSGSFGLFRLKTSREEADAIVAVAPPGTSMEALDFDATRARVLSDELKQFKIIHLATHGILNVNHPELSGLVFSLYDKQGLRQPGFLRVSDIYNLSLPIDLVVLSACQTGIGEQLRSEGLLGLTRGFMYAGAERVVASLWNVDDAATAELMKRFYTYMLTGNKPAAVALREAQLDMIAGKEDTRPAFYWAGFVLQGEWK